VGNDDAIVQVGEVRQKVTFDRRGRTATAAGDIVSISGLRQGEDLVVRQLDVLQRPLGDAWQRASDWNRFHADGSIHTRRMHLRSKLLKVVRAHFDHVGFIEVETPTLLPAPGHEVHIEPFQLAAVHGDRFLQSSPEHFMKRLLGAGFDRIFQICRCFRREHATCTHSPEFTMLEWYRSHASYREIMADVERLLATVAREVTGSTRIVYQGTELELRGSWPRLSVHEAFLRYAELDLDQCDSRSAFRNRMEAVGIVSGDDRDEWDDLFAKVLVERVEPALVDLGPVFLVDYPARLAALARLKPDDRNIAERVELYAGGLELANGYTELDDAAEQRDRFARAQETRRRSGLPEMPIDEEFLRMADAGMPPASGIALGLDRLLMLLTDAADIDQVMAFRPRP